MPSSGTELLKPLQFQVMRIMNIFCSVNETLAKCLRLGLVASGAKHMITELELSIPSLRPLGKGERLEVEFNSQWPMMDRSCLRKWGFQKNPKGGDLGEFLGC